MQRCDPDFAPSGQVARLSSLNPTYPGCSAVITLTEVMDALATSCLNPTYPGCSAVINATTSSRPRLRRVLILLTLDAAL